MTQQESQLGTNLVGAAMYPSYDMYGRNVENDWTATKPRDGMLHQIGCCTETEMVDDPSVVTFDLLEGPAENRRALFAESASGL
jgi:hypothetical protein